MPRRVRSNVFDVTRTDRDEAELGTAIAGLLPHVTPTTTPPDATPQTHGQAPGDSTTSTRREAPETHPERPRGAGGRSTNPTGRITATAARVPVELYDRTERLVKGPGKPSWGQLVAWTCQTKRDAVVDAVLTQLQPPVGLVPRGQNKRGIGATQVTARFTLDEREAFTGTLDAARAAIERADLPDQSRATATTVVIAALEVAANETGA